MANTLILLRHGESEWNAQDRFTGRADPVMSDKGVSDSYDVMKKFEREGLVPEMVLTSSLYRAIQTASYFNNKSPLLVLPALVERDYGEATGMNRDDAREIYGADEVQTWRNSYTAQPPNGESLEDTYKRVVPCLEQCIRPILRAYHTVLVVSHKNCIRTIIKYIERLTVEQVEDVTIGNGQFIVYKLDTDFDMLSKEKHNG